MTILIAAGVALMVLVAVAVIALDSRKDQQRTDEVAPAASALGLQFQAAPPDDVVAALPAFRLFAEGKDRVAENLFSGQNNGLPVKLFDYSYQAGAGSQKDRYAQTVLFLDTSGKLRLPEFSVRAKTVADRIAGAVTTVPSIDLGGDFAQDRLLTGPDEAAVRALFSASVVGFFKDHPGLNAESAGNALLLYRHEVLVPPCSLPDLLKEGQELADALSRSAGR